MTRRTPRRINLRQLWESVRPHSRRGALRATGLIAGGTLALTLLLFGALWGGLAMAAPYLEVTLHPSWNTQTQAGMELSYAGVAACVDCHEPEVTRLVTSKHAEIGCESCHGALLDHALSSPGPEADLEIATPTSELCIRCHEETTGRPDAFPQVAVELHYIVDCLACHNPHSGVSMHPPAVVHPITDLPPCITCHGADAFRARDIRHPEVSEDDQDCIACHELRPDPNQRVEP